MKVCIDGKQVISLKPGDYVGENALPRGESGTATITPVKPFASLEITRAKFQELGLNDKLEFAKRRAAAGGADRPLVTKPPSPKTPAVRKLIAETRSAWTIRSAMR